MKLFCAKLLKYISDKTGVFEHNQRQPPFEVNIRMVSYAREIGMGLGTLESFSKCMNCASPMSQNAYDNLFDKYAQASRIVAENSMKIAAQDLKQKQDGNQDVMVSVDGTWQKRGHSSHNDVVTVVSVITGKALDMEILSNYCKGCSQWKQWKKSQHSSPEYKIWLKSHNCSLNHDGSAGAMEAAGAVKIFSRSQAKYRLRYMEYLRDGDSSSFLKVKESKPYGTEDLITKSECIGHIQKRVGTRLQRLCANYKVKKLRDGKSITGKNRLTTKIIDTLQNYYGMAIRNNTGSLVDMVNAVNASLYHVASTNENPNHGLCPSGEDSWCGWQRDPSSYEHKHGLPDAILELLEPIYQDLADPSYWLNVCMARHRIQMSVLTK